MSQTEDATAAKTEMSPFARSVYEAKYAWKDEFGNVIEDWPQTARRVTTHVMGALGYGPGDYPFEKIYEYIRDRKFLPGGRYLYASGRGLHQTQNCLLMRATDSREGWSKIMHDAGQALMTGAGIGIDYSLLRPSGTPIIKTGGDASGPIALMKIVNEIGRNVMQGGARRSAIWAGLNWHHKDIFDFIRLKDWSAEVRALKEADYNFPAAMDYTNISVLLDDDFFAAFHDPSWYKLYEEPWGSYEVDHAWAQEVYWKTIEKMIVTAEPGFSIDVGDNAGETLRNACTEVTSADNSDICNLGSINLARVDDIYEFDEIVDFATLFLLAGTVYSHVPYEEVEQVRTKNRRLGLGLMGIHEWLLKRGKAYGPDEELGRWLEVYQASTGYAEDWAWEHDLSAPVKTRAIAPTGTIGIVAETTTGVEPIFCVAYKRRVRSARADGQDRVSAQFVVDPTAKRLIEQGVDPSAIEDAYMLALDVERRIAFQAWVQRYVDHAISSTTNLPYPITDEREQREFGNMLMKYLPHLRGITCYPDGARGGQPLTAVPYSVAVGKEGVVFEESEERCVGGACGV